MEKEKDITEIIQSWYETPLSEAELDDATQRFFKFFRLLHSIENRINNEEKENKNDKI